MARGETVYIDTPEYPSAAEIWEDEGHSETDKLLNSIEKKVQREYKQASKEMSKKLNEYMKQFKAEDKAKQAQVKAGEITEEEYTKWRIGRMFTTEQWKAMSDTLAEDMVNANDIARSTIYGHMEDVYALNANYAVYKAEKDAMIDTSFTLYNKRTVENLMKNNKIQLPLPKKGGKAWQQMMNKDLRWNKQKINSSMIQGILQGDSIPQITQRLLKVPNMNLVQAIRSARTMTTAVENQGRDDAYEDLKDKGVELETVWLATLDDRTRHSHRLLHGEIKDPDTGTFSNGLRYPADPLGEPEEVYNCRCCETSYVKGYPIDIPKWSPKMGDMTYEQWLSRHDEKGGKNG